MGLRKEKGRISSKRMQYININRWRQQHWDEMARGPGRRSPRQSVPKHKWRRTPGWTEDGTASQHETQETLACKYTKRKGGRNSTTNTGKQRKWSTVSVAGCSQIIINELEEEERRKKGKKKEKSSGDTTQQIMLVSP